MKKIVIQLAGALPGASHRSPTKPARRRRHPTYEWSSALSDGSMVRLRARRPVLLHFDPKATSLTFVDIKLTSTPWTTLFVVTRHHDHFSVGLLMPADAELPGWCRFNTDSTYFRRTTLLEKRLGAWDLERLVPEVFRWYSVVSGLPKPKPHPDGAEPAPKRMNSQP